MRTLRSKLRLGGESKNTAAAVAPSAVAQATVAPAAETQAAEAPAAVAPDAMSLLFLRAFSAWF